MDIIGTLFAIILVGCPVALILMGTVWVVAKLYRSMKRHE